MPAIGNVLASSILTSTPFMQTSSATVGYDTTFSPDGIDSNGVAHWVNRAGGIQSGYPSASLSVRPPLRGSPNNKITFGLALPTLETVGTSSSSGVLAPNNLVGYKHTFRGEFILPGRGTLAERTLLFNMLLSWLLDTITASDGAPTDATLSPIRTAVTTLAGVY